MSARVVLVTGGTRGIGAAVAAAFAAEGATVVACGRRRPETPSPDAEYLACDVRRPEQVDALVSEIVSRHGHLDVVVNNAGGSPVADAASVSPLSFSKVVELNLLAPFYVAQRANTVMQQQPAGGVIVNVGSVAALRPAPGMAAYSAAKAALSNLTRTLAIEWAPAVRVNCVLAGLVRTEGAEERYRPLELVESTIPLGRLAEASEVAAACVLLASPLASFVSGADLVVDGGGQLPSFLEVQRRAAAGGDPAEHAASPS